MDTKTLSIVGLVLGILIPVAGIIVSAVALNRMKQEGNLESKNIAMAGLIIGIILTALSLVGTICLVCTTCAAAGLAGAGY